MLTQSSTDSTNLLINQFLTSSPNLSQTHLISHRLTQPPRDLLNLPETQPFTNSPNILVNQPTYQRLT